MQPINDNTTAARAPAVALVILACGLMGWQLVTKGAWLMGDFQAFYCAGSMILHGVSPYAAGPLLHCERLPQPFGLHTTRPGVDLPAPFPGYVLLIFVPMALVPYPMAAAIWFVASLGATATACVTLAKLCKRTVIVSFVLLAFALGISVIPYGELAPFIIAALVAGGLSLRQSSLGMSIGALAVTALLPHIAVPVFLAIFLFVKPARLPIIVLGAVLVILDLAVGGPALAVFYLTRVLPNHAASEIAYIMQYSAAWFAQGLGSPDRVALLVGDVSYVVMAIAGIAIAGRLARVFADQAFLFVIPPAFAVIGGPFVHYSEITLALPAALLLYARSSGKARSLAAVAVVLIALPWQWVLTQPLLAPAIVIWSVAIAGVVMEAPVPAAFGVGFGAALLCGLCMATAAMYGPQITPRDVALDPSLAEASWAHFIAAKLSSAGVSWWLGKAPTWIGLTLFAASAAASAYPRNADDAPT